MTIRSRRTALYLLAVAVTTLLFTVVYNFGMATLENRPQPLYRSLEVVFQTFTTTGYGEDAGWDTLWMNLLMILMQLTGIGLILAAVDVFVVPWLRRSLVPSPPSRRRGLSGHVIVCGHTPRTEAFITELEARGREYVLVVDEEDVAMDLQGAGYRVLLGDPEATATLENASMADAIAVVADGADDTNASIALSARDTQPDVRVVTLVEDASLARYHRAAGADDVLFPRQLLGESLSRQVPTAVTADIKEGVPIDEDLQLAELTIATDSSFTGETFDEARLRERFGVNVIGAWFDGEFKTPVDADDRLTGGTRLLVAGEPAQVTRLQQATTSTVREFGPQRILLAGYGDSGQAAYELLSESGSQVTILDREHHEDVDITGDASDPTVLEAAGIGDATAMLLTVGDDTTAIFTTLIARELNPDLHIVVRANDHEDVQKLYRAGADYVQSLATVSGRMLASTVFEDETMLAYDRQFSVVRLPASGLVGSTIVDESVRTLTGCTVVGILSDDTTITDFDPATYTFEAGDEVIVAGTDEAITQFEQEFLD